MLSANRDMCAYCYDVLHSHFDKVSLPKEPFDTSLSCPMFITLHKNGDLRGCIGTLSAKPLSSMSDYVCSSAFRDRRFEPLQRVELEFLDLSVSLLVNYEDGEHCYDWEVGVHGILIDVEAEGNNYSATYLPEVASEQGWSQQDTVNSLLRKAGYRGHINRTILDSIKLTRYQSSKCSLTYTDYVRMRA
jgi:AMME syndrome candidate gene 1 protein